MTKACDDAIVEAVDSHTLDLSSASIEIVSALETRFGGQWICIIGRDFGW